MEKEAMTDLSQRASYGASELQVVLACVRLEAAAFAHDAPEERKHKRASASFTHDGEVVS